MAMNDNQQKNPINNPIQGDEQAIALPAKEKMSKKEKRAVYIGISLISFVLIFVILTVITPIITSRVLDCQLILYGGCDFAAVFFLGGIGSAIIGIPLALVGFSFLFYAFLSRKKIKNPGIMAFLIAFLTVSLFVFLFFFSLTVIGS